MSTYAQTYGFIKTFKNNKYDDVEWLGDYNGDKANILFNMNNNGEQEQINVKLDNDDLLNILKIQPNELSLENSLSRDFLGKSVTLDGLLHKNKRKTRKSRKTRKKRKTLKTYIYKH